MMNVPLHGSGALEIVGGEVVQLMDACMRDLTSAYRLQGMIRLPLQGIGVSG